MMFYARTNTTNHLLVIGLFHLRKHISITDLTRGLNATQWETTFV